MMKKDKILRLMVYTVLLLNMLPIFLHRNKMAFIQSVTNFKKQKLVYNNRTFENIKLPVVWPNKSHGQSMLNPSKILLPYNILGKETSE